MAVAAPVPAASAAPGIAQPAVRTANAQAVGTAIWARLAPSQGFAPISAPSPLGIPTTFLRRAVSSVAPRGDLNGPKIPDPTTIWKARSTTKLVDSMSFQDGASVQLQSSVR